MNSERLSELLDAYLDDRLDREGMAELTRLLETDEEARRAYVRIVDQERGLRDLHDAPVQTKRPARWIVGGAVAAAAAVAVLLYALAGRRDGASEPTTPVVRDLKPPRATPPPVPTPAPQPPPPPGPVSEPKPAPTPEEKPAPPAPQTAPKPVPAPKPAPAPEPPKPAPEVPKPDPRPEPKETVVAVARVEGVQGQAFRISDLGQVPLQAGQEIFPGQGIETGGGESSAVFSLADGTRLELRPEGTVNEISVAGPRRVSLRHGTLLASVPKAPAGQALTLATPQAEVAAVGARFSVTAAEGTRLEVKEGRAKLVRLEDKSAIDVGPGQASVAQRGVSLAARRLTRGLMMPEPALWGEDFQDPREVEKDWKVDRSGLTVSYQGPLDVDLRATGNAEASLTTRMVFAAPVRVSVDVEVPARLRGSLVALRLHSRKDGKDLVHCDLDEQRYYLMTGPTQSEAADATRRALRRERWSVDLHSDGAIVFSVDGKELLRSKRAGAAQDLSVTLLVKSRGDAPAGTHVRFDNFLAERIGK